MNHPPHLSRNLLRKPTSHGDLFSISHQREDDDLDASDPRWPSLFIEYFLEKSDAKNDDLLFFVRQSHSEEEDLDPVFVKRKSPHPHIMPPLDEAVLWKETFFLNLIVQLPCKLTVAVCTRTTTSDGGTSSDGGSTQKTSMTCSRKHVSKRVYALPTRSQMDVKETSMECSYPLIYYVIDDYEEMFEHLIVSEGEYLCVELAVTIPQKSEVDDDTDEDGDNESEEDYYSHSSRRNNKNRRSMTNGPFPQDCNDNKITLFQGAASYSSLVEIYKQKAGSKLNRRFKMGPVTPPTEYVMMRGPGAKGHAQVAITASSIEKDDIDESTDLSVSLSQGFSAANSLGSNHFNTWNGKTLPNHNPINGNSDTSSAGNNAHGRTIRSNSQKSNQPQRSNTSPSFFQSLKRLSQLTDRSPMNPESLKCCMTFVNVPWTSIVSDLTAYARKKNLS
ncbi:hypothetical protein G9A89_022036 [Geosiphon pyriformis]|nr:hypothetical protein G9A89_022036 [Geosiphon pyriformis]